MFDKTEVKKKSAKELFIEAELKGLDLVEKYEGRCINIDCPLKINCRRFLQWKLDEKRRDVFSYSIKFPYDKRTNSCGYFKKA